ncbi:MAG: hypothetical protein PHU25_12420 [Deltaproteobacteria bacterium]|nr:hypothetical protein [Deltaproteobacteria bacterium]
MLWLAAATAAAGEAGRVVILDVPGAQPSAAEVALLLGGMLKDMGVDAETLAVIELPRDRAEWIAAAHTAAAAEPGTLALYGYECRERACRLAVADPRSDTFAVIPLEARRTGPTEVTDDIPAVLAEAAEQALTGSLLPELTRIAERGDPLPPRPCPEPKASPPGKDGGNAKGDWRPWLKIEGGYQGDDSYPDGRPENGARLGVSIMPAPFLGPTFGVGWLGIDEVELSRGRLISHRLTVDLALRVILPVGPAAVSIAPVSRLDVVFSKSDPSGPAPALHDENPELHVGGAIMWHLPFPLGLEGQVGMSVLATVLGKGYDVGGIEAVPESMVRFAWSVGIAWGALAIKNDK